MNHEATPRATSFWVRLLAWLRHVFADSAYAAKKLETALARLGG
jgi:hypothetical protein